jgi:hypothetical protein
MSIERIRAIQLCVRDLTHNKIIRNFTMSNVFLRITLFAMLYVRADILLTCGKHLYDHIITLRGGGLSLQN